MIATVIDPTRETLEAAIVVREALRDVDGVELLGLGQHAVLVQFTDAQDLDGAGMVWMGTPTILEKGLAMVRSDLQTIVQTLLELRPQHEVH